MIMDAKHQTVWIEKEAMEATDTGTMCIKNEIEDIEQQTVFINVNVGQQIMHIKKEVVDEGEVECAARKIDIDLDMEQWKQKAFFQKNTEGTEDVHVTCHKLVGENLNLKQDLMSTGNMPSVEIDMFIKKEVTEAIEKEKENSELNNWVMKTDMIETKGTEYAETVDVGIVKQEPEESEVNSLWSINKDSCRCYLCGEQFSDEKSLRKHVIQFHETRLVDGLGGNMFCLTKGEDLHFHDSEESFAQNMLLSSENNCRLKEETFQCGTCEELFKDQAELDSHKLQHQPEQYSCTVCNIQFKCKNNLNRHVKKHSADTPYRCAVFDCGASFKYQSELDRHKMGHSGVIPFYCQICSKPFKYKSDYDRHMMKHTGEKPYKCSECGCSFSKPYNLKVHAKTHSDGRSADQNMHCCSICERQFLRKSDVNRHLKVHTGEKPCLCSVCGRAFNKDYNLRRHMLLHQDVKPYTCLKCGKGYTEKKSLINHAKAHRVTQMEG